jgi:hypothetical protein
MLRRQLRRVLSPGCPQRAAAGWQPLALRGFGKAEHMVRDDIDMNRGNR